MQTQLQLQITNFPRRVIETSQLADLPIDRKRTLRLKLQSMLMSRVVNALLNHLGKEQKEEFAKKAESTANLSAFFILLFHSIPSAEDIIFEETELLFQNLTK